MKMLTSTLLVCLAVLAAGSAAAATYTCESIHAVRIALEEGLGDCDRTVMTTLVGRSSGGPLADLANPAWHADCLGLTANGCAARHFEHPERTVQGRTGDQALRFLDTKLRCSDGTRPAYYLAPGSGAGAGKWVIYLNGSSGRCGSGVDRASGTLIDLGQRCFDAYVIGEADSAFLLREAKTGDGIMSPVAANPFHDWNRVHIPSCSNDQYQGRRAHRLLEVASAPDRYRAAVFTQGHLIVQEVLLDLARRGTLGQADTVVLHGVSGGAGGLIATLDEQAAYTSTLLGPDARVVALLDSRGAEPGLDNSEARFDDPLVTCPSIFAADCAGQGFDQPPQGVDGAGFAFDRSAYLPHAAAHPTRGGVREQARAWDSPLDVECEQVHGREGPECFDVNHVLFNHLRTPVFVATSISDSNQWNNPIEMLGEAQAETSWQALDCGASPGLQYIAHARNQLVSYARDRDNPSGGADGESHGRGPIGVWAPQVWDHVLAHDRCKFGALTVGGVTLAQAFSRWLGGDPVRLVDGFEGRTTGSECGVPAPRCP
jgi:hypothetical protein